MGLWDVISMIADKHAERIGFEAGSKGLERKVFYSEEVQKAYDEGYKFGQASAPIILAREVVNKLSDNSSSD